MPNHDTVDFPEPGTLSALSYGWQKMTANFLVFFPGRAGVDRDRDTLRW